MTWLKKYGLEILKVIGIVAGISPVLTAGASAGSTVASVSDDLTKVGQAVAEVEVVISAITAPGVQSGAQKLQAATLLVAQIVQTSELLAGKKIANEALFTQGCTKITDGMADILNSLKPDVAVAKTT
jgi:hypothetical protein